MRLQTGEKKSRARVLLVSAALLGILAFAGAPSASADNYDKCQRRIAKEEHRLHEAVEDHGWYSRQADHARHELREARERCWNERHRWWDENRRCWRYDRDWDDYHYDRP